MTIDWEKNISELSSILQKLSVTHLSGERITPDAGLQQWSTVTQQIREKNQTVFLIGNGASASMASHFAADLAKNGGIRTQVFTDLALMTAIANDICYEEVYAEPLRRYMQKGDMLVAISSSGNSPNIVSGVKAARILDGTVITLSAMSTKNVIRQSGDLNFHIPARTYGLAETAHAAILHYWMDAQQRLFNL